MRNHERPRDYFERKKAISYFLQREVNCAWDNIYGKIENMNFYDTPDYDYFLEEIDKMAGGVDKDEFD
jgi:hypothetical protein